MWRHPVPAKLLKLETPLFSCVHWPSPTSEGQNCPRQRRCNPLRVWGNLASSASLIHRFIGKSSRISTEYWQYIILSTFSERLVYATSSCNFGAYIRPFPETALISPSLRSNSVWGPTGLEFTDTQTVPNSLNTSRVFFLRKLIVQLRMVWTQEWHTLMKADRPGWWNPEKSCCWWLRTFQQPVQRLRRSSSASSYSRYQLLARIFWSVRWVVS